MPSIIWSRSHAASPPSEAYGAESPASCSKVGKTGTVESRGQAGTRQEQSAAEEVRVQGPHPEGPQAHTRQANGILGSSPGLVGYGGTKTFRSRYPLSGKACTRSIGRLGENSTETGNDFSVRAAREQARLDRAIAHEGNDPREVHVRKRTDAFTVRQGVDLFIMKERNLRSWDQAEKNLNRHLKTWMKKPARSITRPMARDLID